MKIFYLNHNSKFYEKTLILEYNCIGMIIDDYADFQFKMILKCIPDYRVTCPENLFILSSGLLIHWIKLV